MKFPDLRLHVERTKSELAFRVADDFVSFLKRINYRERGIAIAFSGGSTPELLFKTLARDYYRSLINWSKIHIFQVDERWVPFDHPENNFNDLRNLLLEIVEIPKENIHRMPVASCSNADAQSSYIKELENYFGRETPVFDLIFLGIGDDGHTASIFPGESGQDPVETDAWISIPYVEKIKTYRMTMSAKVLLSSKQTWFLVTGSNKASVVNEVINGRYNPKKYPSQLMGKSNGLIEFYLDNSAYTELKTSIYPKSTNRQ